MCWHWPGNVLELENFIERSVILSSGSVLRAPLTELQTETNADTPEDATLQNAGREHILRVLRECGGGNLGGARGGDQARAETDHTAIEDEKARDHTREPLLELLKRHGEAGLRSAQALSREFQAAYRDIHDLIFARPSAGKLAKLLRSWTPPSVNGKEVRVSSGLTHEEMAQIIGASRESVTRLLSDLRKKQLIRLEGSTLVIRNRMALEAMVS